MVRSMREFAGGHTPGDFFPVLCANFLPLLAMWQFDWKMARFLLCFWFELACIVLVLAALVGGVLALRVVVSGAVFLALSLVCVIHGALDPIDREWIGGLGAYHFGSAQVQFLMTLATIALAYAMAWYRERKIRRGQAWVRMEVDSVMLHVLAGTAGLIVVSLGAANFPLPLLLPVLLASIKALVEVRWVLASRRLAMGLRD